MKWLAIGIIFLLTGCRAEAPGWQVERAHKFCEDKQGVAHMSAQTNSYVGTVRCNDGTYTRFTSGGN